MRKGIFILIIMSSMLQSCWLLLGGSDDDINFNGNNTNFEAVVMEREAFEASFEMLPPQTISKAGKIYIKDNFLFVNDVNKGFQIYNYSNPTQPIPLVYLKTLGATDVAVRDNLLYINQAVDLITVLYDTSTQSFSVIDRDRDVFPQKRAPNGQWHNTADNEIIIAWNPI